MLDTENKLIEFLESIGISGKHVIRITIDQLPNQPMRVEVVYTRILWEDETDQLITILEQTNLKESEKENDRE